MVSIYIEHKVNGEKSLIAPKFNFDDTCKLIIPPNRGNRETFTYLARHVKTTVAKFKEYIEVEYLREKSYEDLPF